MNPKFSAKEILSDLNAEQKKAVTHDKGPLLIIAGAGTGKTTVITRRIAHLIAQKKAKPSEILALTFTDKAADEMESRVDLLVPYGFIDVNILTFHAFGDKVLRDHAIDLGIDPDYRVLSRAEQIVFFREHIFEFPLKYYKSLSDPTRYIEALISAISRARDEDVAPEDYIRRVKKDLEGIRRGKKMEEVEEAEKYLEVARIYKKYQELKVEKGFVDFGDQVNLTLKLFRKRPAILKKYQEKFKYILIDEFQDTNYAQFELLKLIFKKHKNITVVADDDQSIYKFRGASISNIFSFEKVYRKCKKVVLKKNYRSSQIILDTAYRLIRHNDPERLEVKSKVDKKLISCVEGSKRSSRPVHKHFDRVATEADWVAQRIKELHEKKGFSLADFAILVRANADAEPFRQSLNMLGLPHQFSGAGGLYVYPEVKLAVSFLRVIGDLADSVSLYNLALSEVYQLNSLDLQKMNTFASRRNYTLHHVFTHLEEYEILSDIKAESRATVRKIMEDIKYYLDFAKERSTGEVLYKFLRKSGYLKKLTKEESETNEAKLRNLAAFFEKVKEFKDVAEMDRVSEFVKYLNIIREAGDDPESARVDEEVKAVNVMTVHKAKGLEFKVVFLVSLVADKFPVRKRGEVIELPEKLIKDILPKGDFHLMEERRLFYVGMTRTKDELYLTSAEDYGGKRKRKVSQFVLEALDIPRADISKLKKTPLEQIELFGQGEKRVTGKRDEGRGMRDEVISLSFYQIDDYLTCPLKYKYIHVLRVPLLPSHLIMYGSALHKAVQAYFSATIKRQKFSQKDLLGVFLNNWTSEGFISREHEEKRLEAGKKALKRFYLEQKKSKEKPYLVEEEFKFVKDKIKLRGRYDLVLKDKNDIVIADFKSSEVKKQEDANRRARQSLQLSIYALAWAEMKKALPESLELRFLETGLIGATQKDKKDLEKTWQKIKGVASGIRKSDFHSTPNKRVCGFCPYSEVCPSAA